MNPKLKGGARAYKANAVLTAPRLKLVQMLYDEAVAKLNQAKHQLESGDELMFRSSVLKVQSIVGELFSALNMKDGKEIADNLADLYNFSLAQLADASLNKSRSSLEGVLKILSTLEDGWDSITDPEEKP